MNKPKPKTRTYVDWNEYKKYLTSKYKEFVKIQDELWMWFCDTSDFSNGCYVHMEPADSMGWPEDHPATWLANRLFADYPELAKASTFGDTIYLWVWW